MKQLGFIFVAVQDAHCCRQLKRFNQTAVTANRKRASVRGCRDQVLDNPWTRSGSCGIRVQERGSCFPGVLTATELILAWKAGVDFIKMPPVLKSVVTVTFEHHD
jgi:hypothetical protein